jgi:hypothetical protein
MTTTTCLTDPPRVLHSAAATGSVARQSIWNELQGFSALFTSLLLPSLHATDTALPRVVTYFILYVLSCFFPTNSSKTKVMDVPRHMAMVYRVQT